MVRNFLLINIEILTSNGINKWKGMTCRGAGEDIVDRPALKRPRGVLSRQNLFSFRRGNSAQF